MPMLPFQLHVFHTFLLHVSLSFSADTRNLKAARRKDGASLCWIKAFDHAHRQFLAEKLAGRLL